MRPHAHHGIETTDQKPLSAAVLAGGKSSRMGRDKAFLPLDEGGRVMIEIVLDHLRAVADDVMIVANDGERFASFGTRVVPDLDPGLGALAGIHAAVAAARHEHCLVVACDMPFLDLSLLRWMAGQSRDYDVLVPLLPGESRQRPDGLVYQTLHAIYSKKCVEAIEREIARGNRQVIGFFESVHVRTVGVADVQRHDPSFRSFFNANTPEALEVARRMARAREPFSDSRRSPDEKHESRRAL